MSDNETIGTSKLSYRVVLELFRDGLRSAVDDPNQPLEDPAADKRPEGSEFILTSFPSSNVFYPLIVVDEFNDTNERIDAQADLYRHGYSVRVRVYAPSNTDLYHLRDGIRHYVESKFLEHMRNGFSNGTIDSSIAAEWEDNPDVQRWEFVISGVVHTTYKKT